MKRRDAIAAITAIVAGCKSRAEPLYTGGSNVPNTTQVNWPDRIAQRAAQHRPPSRLAQFDPATLLLVAQLVWGLLRYCMAAQIRRQHSALVQHPHGHIEQRMRSKLTRQYIEEHPAADAVEIDHHVADTLAAFAAASKAEIEDLIADAKARNDIEPLQWENARRAAELTEISE